jgi:hypothetical protein
LTPSPTTSPPPSPLNLPPEDFPAHGANPYQNRPPPSRNAHLVGVPAGTEGPPPQKVGLCVLRRTWPQHPFRPGHCSSKAPPNRHSLQAAGGCSSLRARKMLQ